MTVVYADIEAAAQRIANYAHRTPVLRSASLDALAGCALYFKAENFQRTGSFKFRGACNAVWTFPDEVARRGVVTHSSGNHGAALALAAATRGIPAHVVVPRGAVATKVAAILRYGARVEECAPSLAAREAMAAEIAARTGAQLVHPFTDPRVIAGQGTVLRELLEEVGALDAVIAPIGGGGLLSGSALAAHARNPGIAVFAAEPEGAADAYASFAAGRCVGESAAETICDGLRASLGAINFDLLRAHEVEVLLASDAEAVAAMRLCFERLKIVVEPSAAIALAAVLRWSARFAGRRVGVVLTGGNVDLDQLPWC
jgi:threonine dehydratase